MLALWQELVEVARSLQGMCHGVGLERPCPQGAVWVWELEDGARVKFKGAL